MRDLTFSARAYLIGCSLLGLFALAGLLYAGDGLPTRDQWLLAGLLAIAAGAAQFLVASRSESRYSDHVTLAPVFAAILLLPTPLIALVIILTFLPEWIRYRRTWFVQSFNIASWLVAAAVAMLVIRRAPHLAGVSTTAWIVGSLLVGIVAFVFIQTLMLGITLKLARGQSLLRAKRDGRNDAVRPGRKSRSLLSKWMQYRPGETAIDGSDAPGISHHSHDSGDVHSSNLSDADRNLFRNLYAEPTSDIEPPEEASVRPPKPTVQISIFITIIVALGTLLSISIDRMHFPMAHAPWIGLVLFVGLVALAHGYAADIDGRGTTSVAVVPMIGAALLFNSYGVVAAAGVFALVAKLKAHSPLHRMLFNFGCMLLATGSAGLVFRLIIHGSLARTSYDRMLLPGILSGLVFYLVNHLFLCLIRSLAEHRSMLEIWREDYRWLWPHYVTAGLLGAALGATYEVMGWVVTIVMASPVALMHLTITQFINRTTGYVNELRRLNRQLSDSYESTLQALSRALDTRDAETEEHSQRVSRYTDLVGRRFGLSDEEVAHLRRGAMLHDIGKIGVPDAILLKPARLSPSEVEAMRKHPTIGHTMIAHIPFLAQAAEIVLHHHESYDGTGYPNRLAGEEIPLGARIFAVVDTLDAMTSDRPYRKALSFEEALAEIERERGRQFDPAIVDTLLAVSIPELVHCRNGVSWEATPDQLFQPVQSLSPAPA